MRDPRRVARSTPGVSGSRRSNTRSVMAIAKMPSVSVRRRPGAIPTRRCPSRSIPTFAGTERDSNLKRPPGPRAGPAGGFLDGLLHGLLRFENPDVTHCAEQDGLSHVLGHELLVLLRDPNPRGIVVFPPRVEVAVPVALPHLRAGEPTESEDIAVGASIRPTARRRLLDDVLVLLYPVLKFPKPAFFRAETCHVEHSVPRGSAWGAAGLSIPEGGRWEEFPPFPPESLSR